MNNGSAEVVRPTSLDLSKLSADEILQLRDRIMAEARSKIDPQGTGFDPVMERTDDGSFFSTDDMAFKDWWDWVEQVVRTISDGLTRVALGLSAGGLAIAASNMYGSAAGSRYADITLGAAGVMGAWFLVAAVRSTMRGK